MRRSRREPAGDARCTGSLPGRTGSVRFIPRPYRDTIVYIPRNRYSHRVPSRVVLLKCVFAVCHDSRIRRVREKADRTRRTSWELDVNTRPRRSVICRVARLSIACWRMTHATGASFRPGSALISRDMFDPRVLPARDISPTVKRVIQFCMIFELNVESNVSGNIRK